ncbi:MAG: hypothetical protein KF874_09030 [Rhizobiaceae bacterium]|nr:hypothetical protein [Rhizobiaceae bacterium]
MTNRDLPRKQSTATATPHPSTEKVSGAGPALAEHSKDAKAPKSGRSEAAYVKPNPKTGDE